ncbi:MAG: BatA and WFA domain-containing protein [Euryarchaeota archaeon]|nr:BatA and WFA domain-containing protein [Euryarchaeota archaeon]
MLFANLQLAIWAFFLSVIPLIIVYLLKPKAKDIMIPSVMFIAQITEKQKKIARTIRKIIKDPLFLIQLLILLLLILAIASPYNEERTEIKGGHTIIVLDGSASMQAGDRFVKAMERADEHLTARNSIILAENIPVLVLHSGDLDAARNVLADIPMTATTADLYQAILLGSAMLTDGNGRIVVISDFANWEGEDPNVAKKLAEADGIDISFVSVSGGRNDIAITGGWLSDGMESQTGHGKYTCIIKNYMNSPVDAKIDVLYGGDRSTHSLALGARDSKYFALNDIGTGVTEIVVHPDDDMMVDNHAYIVIPASETHAVLYISDYNDAPSATVMKLLPSVDATFMTQGAARSTDVHDYDAVVVGLCNGSLKSSLCDTLADYASSGGKVVVMAQEGLLHSDTGRLLPVSLFEKANETEIKEVRESVMLRDIDVEDIAIGYYLKGEKKSGSVAWIVAEDGMPIISYGGVGLGKVVYLGIPDITGDYAWSDFHTMPEYPIFWLNLVDYLCGTGGVKDCNKLTGSAMQFDSKVRATTPDKRVIKTDNLLLDQTGVYEMPGKLVSANLYDAAESNLEDSGITTAETTEASTGKTVQTTTKKEFDWILLILALALICAELYYIRSRGEL